MSETAETGSGNHPIPALASHPALFGNRNFMLLWAGYVVSALGDRIHFIVMLQLISNLIALPIKKVLWPVEFLLGFPVHFEAGTRESSQLTIMMLLPFLIFGPFTGILADRLPRRMIMIVADLARVVIVIVARTIFLRETDIMGAGMLYGLLLASEMLLATFAAAFSPARLALLPQLVHPNQLLRANSMTNAAGTIASLIGFVIGGFLVKYDLNVAMFVDAGTFLGSALCLLLMHMPRGASAAAVRKEQSKGVLRDIVGGLHYIWTHKRTLQVIGLMFLFWSCGTIILNGLTGIVTKHFHLSITDYSYFMGVVGVGMIVGAASVSLARRGIPKEVGIAWSMTAVGVFLFLFSLATRWQTGLILLVICAAAGAVLLVSLDTLLQRIVPNFVRGRVMGAKDVITTFGLISFAIPLAIDPNIDDIIRVVMRVLAVIVVGVGFWLVVHYYRDQRLPLVLAIARRFCSAYLAIWKSFELGNACRIPPHGPVIFVANHTTAFDPVVMQTASKRRAVQFMMAKEYYLQKPMHYLYKALRIIPVNRTGNDTASIRAALRALQNGDCIGMFPEGKISLDGRMNAGRPGVALLALMSGATVAPAYITGTNVHAGMSRDFLVRTNVKVYFGRPLKFDDLKGHGEEARTIATQRIMDAIMALRDRFETDPQRRISAVEAGAPASSVTDAGAA